MSGASLTSSYNHVTSEAEDFGLDAYMPPSARGRGGFFWRARLQRAAAGIGRIPCINFLCTRHELKLGSVLRRAVAAVAIDKRYSTATEVVGSR
jgi:hypothetical protein